MMQTGNIRVRWSLIYMRDIPGGYSILNICLYFVQVLLYAVKITVQNSRHQ